MNPAPQVTSIFAIMTPSLFSAMRRYSAEILLELQQKLTLYYILIWGITVELKLNTAL
jgi:hypothetical protein